jgi:hypothetical protein
VLAFTYAVLEKTSHEMLATDKLVAEVELTGEQMKKMEKVSDESIRGLLGRWKALNLVRGVVLGVGTGVGIYAVLE